MSLVATDAQNYSDIADAIRAKNGKATTYKPREMAPAILALTGSEYPVMEVPDKYKEYVDYCRQNFYSGDFVHLIVWEVEDWVAVSFLMEDFSITEYDVYSTEFKATGWYTCGYTVSTGKWTSHDYRNTVSPGGNYARYIQFASCEIMYGSQKLFPVGVMNEVKINSVAFDDAAGTCTVSLATGQVEVLTFGYDDAGNVISVTDSQGHTTTLAGVTA